MGGRHLLLGLGFGKTHVVSFQLVVSLVVGCIEHVRTIFNQFLALMKVGLAPINRKQVFLTFQGCRLVIYRLDSFVQFGP